jgi:hypothetical protein
MGGWPRSGNAVLLHTFKKWGVEAQIAAKVTRTALGKEMVEEVGLLSYV